MMQHLCVQPTGCDGIIGSQLAIDKCLQCSKSLDTVCIKHEAIVNTTYSGEWDLVSDCSFMYFFAQDLK